MKIAAFLLCCASVFAQSAQKSALDKATLESYVRNVEFWIPQVTVKVDDPKPSTLLPGFSEVWLHASYNGQTKDEMYYVSKDGRNVIKGDVYDVNQSPFQANLDRLKTDSQPAFGAGAAAPVKIVVFSDFECPYCKEEGQSLRQNIPASFADKVRVYVLDFPLESIHPWARTAALAGRCVTRQDPAKFWDFFDWIYAKQTEVTPENINAKLQDFAKEKGIDGQQLGSCIDTKATEAEVNASIAEGHTLQVSQTPTMFINGRKLDGGLQWPVLQQLINMELEHQTQQAKTAKAPPKADEKCCEVVIPQLVK